ncbi:MAG: hypothetical protein AB8B87_15465 [Granulosicoccus sp.]
MKHNLYFSAQFLSTLIVLLGALLHHKESHSARNDGPNPTSRPTAECIPGVYARDHAVYEGDDGEYKAYNVTGHHRFDASNAIFDGIESDGDTLEHWPVAIKAADKIDRKMGRASGTLRASAGGSKRHTYSVRIPRNLKVAHFYAEFNRPDPGNKLYMKLTTPDGRSSFHNNARGSFESAVIRSPKSGVWKVSVAIKSDVSNNIGYSLSIDDDETIDIAKIKGNLIAAPSGQTHHTYNVKVPSGLSRVHFHTQFSRVHSSNMPYMKLTDPSGQSVFYNLQGVDYESAVINNPRGGVWKVRVARKRGTGANVSYTLRVDNDKNRPTTGCWTGGLIYGAWDENGYGIYRLSDTQRIKRNKVTWDYPFHGSGGITLEISNFLVEDISIINHGDGIRTNGDDITVVGAYVADIHDDCVENDRLGNLLISDSFFDGCYVGFSARPDLNAPYDGSDKLFEIRNTLVRLEKQPTVYRPSKYGTSPGHGNFFKWTPNRNTAIKLSVHNSIFLIPDVPRHGDVLGLQEIGEFESCSRNIIVWTGPGPFPDADSLPSCFRLTTNVSEWNSAVSAWRARHPNRPVHP